MNEVLKAIHSRRSIRSFRSEQIKKEELDAILEAGIFAPSANNVQGSRITVVQSMETAGRIESWIVDEIRRSGDERRLKLIERSQGKLFYGAPTLLILSADSSDPFGTTNIAALIENLLIAAESLNIGSCWIGMLTALARSQKKEEYAEKLHLPKGFLPYFGVVLGYKAIGEVPMPERRKDIISFLDS